MRGGVEKQSLLSWVAHTRTRRGAWVLRFTRVPTISWCLPDTEAEWLFPPLVIHKPALVTASLHRAFELVTPAQKLNSIWAEMICFGFYFIPNRTHYCRKYSIKLKGKERQEEKERMREPGYRSLFYLVTELLWVPLDTEDRARPKKWPHYPDLAECLLTKFSSPCYGIKISLINQNMYFFFLYQFSLFTKSLKV